MARLRKLARAAGGSQAAHNRRISPFERGDFSQWARARKLTPVERLAAQWLTDAASLRRNGEAEVAGLLESHARQLKQAVSKR